MAVKTALMVLESKSYLIKMRENIRFYLLIFFSFTSPCE
ncbi:hypothetical protein P20480_2169 [Pseudoalteromonas sp. BSi20480]|nr:hypothetical protein P20480_2169 [Pseudoalteromonas sp. BSi20480]